MKNKRIVILSILFVSVLFFLIGFVLFTFRKKNIIETSYDKGKYYLNNEEYNEAEKYLSDLKNYKNGSELLKQAQDGKIYDEAINFFENNDYKKAIENFSKIENFKDSKEKLRQSKYKYAIQLYEQRNYSDAEKLFIELKDYNRSEWYLAQINVKNREQANKTIYDEACKSLSKGKYKEALEDFNSIIGYKDSKEKAQECEENIKRLKLSQTISAGIEYVLAITKDNKVKAAGDESFGKCDVSSWENIVSIDGYGEITIGLKDDGTIKVLGNLNKEQKKKIESQKHIIDIAAGQKYVVALKSNGKVVAEGHNGNEQCNVDDWEKIVDIDAGYSTTVGLTEDGKLLFAGKESDELKKEYKSKKEDWKDVVKISVSGGQPSTDPKSRGDIHVVGLKPDKTVVHIGKQATKDDGIAKDYDKETKHWKNIVDIAAGDWFTVGLDEDGNVLITGKDNPNGMKHTRYTDNEKNKKWRKIKGIAAGYGTTLVIKDNGKLDIMGFTDGKDVGDNALEEVLQWPKVKINPKIID